ncbi:MAG: serine/threonine-protein kinase [bacterium]
MSDSYGRYTVVDKVGQGGMSVVYRARDPALDRIVALKVMHPHLAERAESKLRFSREARAVARLRHPHIVEVYDYAPEGSEQAYIVSEFIDGPTLRQLAEEHPIRHPETAALVVLPVVEALAHAHAGGVIHRDVKPENVMIRPDGAPVLMDFGIAQMVGNETLTATGTVLGSPAHMAPEVVDGHEIGAPADVFSVGTVLYWLVCGALPFTGPNPSALFRRILEGRFDPVLQRRPHAGKAMARLIERCLAHEPGARPTAAALAEALRAQLADAGLVDLPVERARYFADPAVYEDALGRAMVPRLVARAREAAAARRTAAALDLLDRALALDEHHPEAEALLARIERGQRRGQRLRWALAAAALLAVGGGVWWAVGLIEPGNGEAVGTVGGAGEGTPTAARPADAAAPAPDAALPDAAMPDAATADAATADALSDATPDAAPADATPDAARAAAPSPLAPSPAPSSDPPARPRPDASAPPPPATRAVVEVHGQLKGAVVHVDEVPAATSTRSSATTASCSAPAATSSASATRAAKTPCTSSRSRPASAAPRRSSSTATTAPRPCASRPEAPSTSAAATTAPASAAPTRTSRSPWPTSARASP